MRTRQVLMRTVYTLIMALVAIRCDAVETSALIRIGIEIRHPIASNIVARIVSETREGWVDKVFVPRGLYISNDGGVSWKRVCERLSFEKLYIHPKTGKWFASIWESWVATNREGFVEITSGTKILMSDDGVKWKDITRGNGHLDADVDWFNQDPDFPDRVCLKTDLCMSSHPSWTIYQSVDDNYSSWTLYRPTGDMNYGDYGKLERFLPKRSRQHQESGVASTNSQPEAKRFIRISSDIPVVDIEQTDVNVRWNMTNAVLNLTTNSFLSRGTVNWSSIPAGISGSGTSVAFDPSKLTQTSYVVTAHSSLVSSNYCFDTCTVRVLKSDIEQ